MAYSNTLRVNEDHIYNTYIRHLMGRKHIFDIYVTEYSTALTTILPILFLYLNTVIVTAGMRAGGLAL